MLYKPGIMCDQGFGSSFPIRRKDVAILEGQNQNIVSALQSLLTVDECYVCFRLASINNHYKTKKHVVNVLSWIRQNAARFNFNIKDISSLYCEVCNDVFESVEASLFHYTSDKHNENQLNYCEACKKHVLDIIRHRLTNSHISASKQDKPLRKNSVNNDKVDKGSSKQKNVVPFDGINSVQSPVMTIAEKLGKLLKTAFCGICQISFDFNMIEHHYLQSEHILSVRKWLAEELQKAQVNIQNTVLLYCEACGVNLCGSNEASKHYYNAGHLSNKKTYCAICVLRGTPDDLEEHNLRTHPTVGSSEVLPKDLARMVSTLERKLDSLKLQLTSERDSKYERKSLVEKWIDSNTSLVESDNDFSAEVTDNKPEILDGNKTEYDECYQEPLKEEIFVELNEIIDKVYFSKIISYEDVLARLRDLNRNIADASVAPSDEIFDEFDVLPPENIGSNNSIPDFDIEEDIAENHSKQKLAMEIRRVKLVLTNFNRINVERALQYVVNLNQLLQDLISNSTEFCDIVSIFEIECKSMNGSEEALQDELKKLEDALMDDNKIKVGIALDCITQFNIQLEKILFS